MSLALGTGSPLVGLARRNRRAPAEHRLVALTIFSERVERSCACRAKSIETHRMTTIRLACLRRSLALWKMSALPQAGGPRSTDQKVPEFCF